MCLTKRSRRREHWWVMQPLADEMMGTVKPNCTNISTMTVRKTTDSNNIGNNYIQCRCRWYFAADIASHATAASTNNVDIVPYLIEHNGEGEVMDHMWPIITHFSIIAPDHHHSLFLNKLHLMWFMSKCRSTWSSTQTHRAFNALSSLMTSYRKIRYCKHTLMIRPVCATEYFYLITF